MHRLLDHLIKQTILKPKRRWKEKQQGKDYTSYDVAKGFIELKDIIKSTLADVVLITLGIFSAGFGLKGFLLSNGFIDGGATGISLLVARLTDFSLSYLLVAINLPFLVLGYRVIGKGFAIKAVLAIIGLALVVHSFPYPEITNDKLLISVFGGFFLGAGIGLSVRGGAVIDGTEILAISLSRNSGLSIGDIILIINVIIFSFAAYLISIEVAMYAILTYLAASKTVDFILEGIEEYTGVTIISIKADEIREMLTFQLNQGVTVYKGEHGFGKSGTKIHDMKIIYTVVTRLEISRLKAEVHRLDHNAFIVMHSVKDTVGGMTKKRRLKH
jgi:uncharacterized membrane-anchored protein YitT (DUF2179 family)